MPEAIGCMVYGILKNTTQVHWENWRKVDVTNKCDVITDLAKFVEHQTPEAIDQAEGQFTAFIKAQYS